MTYYQNEPLKKLYAGGYATSKAAENRSRTAFQNRIDKSGEASQTFESKSRGMEGSKILISNAYNNSSSMVGGSHAISSTQNERYGSQASLLANKSGGQKPGFGAAGKRVSIGITGTSQALGVASAGNLINNSVRVSDRSASKGGSRASR